MSTVAYQGEPGAFSERAAKALFGNDVRTKPYESFKQVFDAVSSGRAQRAIVPVENSLFGSVHEVYDLLLAHKLHIVGEVKLRIQLHVMALPGVTMNAVRSIYSHPQALGQCDRFLRSLNGVQAVVYYDTAGSAKMIRREHRRDAAALASAQAARVYKLRILKKNVESNHRNFTRFLVLARRPVKHHGSMKTSIVFAVKNIPGALFKALAVFALREVNLLKIESRPLVGRPWEYLFYLDFAGSQEDKHVRQALNHLQELSTFIRILGSYPHGRTVSG
jgi:prephenate dehydratase